VVHIYNEVLVSNKEGNYVIFRRMDGSGGHVKRYKPSSERQ
jgi:hypothetical protein